MLLGRDLKHKAQSTRHEARNPKSETNPKPKGSNVQNGLRREMLAAQRASQVAYSSEHLISAFFLAETITQS
jgi:hypothetical protein